ncbi:3351_t:CDS:2 [Acaulospora colombiana]|uniref:3351_t:CDS:1 n=1 Tax=Acaulospora colombiana TaxID=27376 RepID=A0ACA9JW42_9GLOM|nr:3351_t:CDS:2 [Acaulospora colombiana]
MEFNQCNLVKFFRFLFCRDIFSSKNDFPFLFDSEGTIKDINGIFDENNKVAQPLVELRKNIEKFLNLNVLGGGQYKTAFETTERNYPSEIPPECHESDKTYRERYIIAQTYITGWKTCIDEMQDCQKMCDKLDRYYNDTVNGIYSKMNEVLCQLTELNSLVREKTNEYNKIYKDTTRQLNRLKMGRAPAYKNQPQECSKCKGPYAYLKWCKSCESEQLMKQFARWINGIDNSMVEFVQDSLLNIKYPNGHIEWIPFEQFSNVEFINKGGFGIVYKANWVEGLGSWDYVLGERVRYKNTPVALKILIESNKELSPSFFNEIKAYMKSSSSTVLRCYGVSREPTTGDYIMVLPFAHGSDLNNYLKENATNLNWIDRLDILRHILFGLLDIHRENLFNNDPTSPIVKQFVESKLDLLDVAYNLTESKHSSRDLSKSRETLRSHGSYTYTYSEDDEPKTKAENG